MPKILDDEQIFRAVIQTVSENGYSGSTTKQMAAASGISEVTLFRKYGTKQQMVKEAISFILGKVDLKSAGQYTGDVHADLTRIVKLYNDLANEYGDFASRILFEMQRHPDLFDLVNESLSIISGFAELIIRYQNEGTLVKEHPLLAIASLVSPIIFAFNLKKAIPSNQLEIVDLRGLVTNFLNGRLNKTSRSL